jgi:hypothetical protein
LSARIAELRAVIALMVEHRIDSVKLPNGLEVLKTTHNPYAVPVGALPRGHEDWEARPPQRPVNEGETSGRLPVPDEEILFAASAAPELSLDEFAPPLPEEEPE